MGQLHNFTIDGRSLVGDVFIETGTYQGDTTRAAVDAGFRSVHTIEVCGRHVARARQRFATEPRVTVHCGSSPDVLPSVCDPDRATTFFLDGHYQGGELDEIDPRLGQCPLLMELDIINAVPWIVKPYIVIDDAFVFSASTSRMAFVNLDPRQWPTLAEVMAKLVDNYSVHNRNDMLFCFPK